VTNILGDSSDPGFENVGNASFDASSDIAAILQERVLWDI